MPRKRKKKIRQRSDQHVSTVLEHIIERYGAQKARRMIRDLQAGLSGQIIANYMGVTRERIRQWKDVLGYEVRVYEIYPSVQKLADKAPKPELTLIEGD